MFLSLNLINWDLKICYFPNILSSNHNYFIIEFIIFLSHPNKCILYIIHYYTIYTCVYIKEWVGISDVFLIAFWSYITLSCSAFKNFNFILPFLTSDSFNLIYIRSKNTEESIINCSKSLTSFDYNRILDTCNKYVIYNTCNQITHCILCFLGTSYNYIYTLRLFIWNILLLNGVYQCLDPILICC